MNCNQVRNLLSAYIDGEAEETLSRRIALHLKDCSACRRQEMDLRLMVIGPLNQTPEHPVPDHIWSNIRNRIINEELARQKRSLLERILSPFMIKRMALAFATITIFLAITVVFMRHRPLGVVADPTVANYLQEQAEFISHLSNGVNGYVDGNGGFGTSIEELLL